MHGCVHASGWTMTVGADEDCPPNFTAVDWHEADALSGQLAALEARLSSEFQTAIDAAVDELRGTDTTADLTALNGHANPNPFAIELKTCTTLGGETGLDLNLGGVADLEGDIGAGAKVFGNGGKVSGKVTAGAGLGFALGGRLGVGIEGCTAGIFLPFDGEHSQAQLDFISGATSAAEGLQTALAETVDFVAKADDAVEFFGGLVGLGSGGLDSTPRLVSSSAGPVSTAAVFSDPTAILDDPFGPLADLLPGGDLFEFDAEGLFSDLSDPCSLGGELGSGVSDICAGVSTALEASIEFIDTTISEIDMAIDDLVSGFPAQIDSLCNSSQGVFNDISGVSINLGSISGFTLLTGFTLFGGLDVPFTDNDIPALKIPTIKFPSTSLGSVSPFSVLGTDLGC